MLLLAALTAIGGLLAACSDGAERSGAGTGAPPGSITVRGRITVQDDTSDRTEGARGSVVAVTSDRGAAMWAASNGPPPAPAEFRYADRSFAPGTLDGLASAVAPLRDGRFSMQLPEATYLLCLADAVPPRRVQGCVEARIGANANLELTKGEGGLRLRDP